MDRKTIDMLDYGTSRVFLHVGAAAFGGWMARVDLISIVAFSIIEKAVTTIIDHIFPTNEIWFNKCVQYFDPTASEKNKSTTYFVFGLITAQIRAICATFVLRVVVSRGSFPSALMANWRLSMYRALGVRAMTYITGVK